MSKHVALALAGSAFLVAGQVAGRAARDTLFLSTFSPERLPLAMVGASVLSIVCAIQLSASLSRRSPGRVAPAALGLNALCFAGEAALYPVAPGVVAAALYLQVSAMLPVLGSAFWSLINERFDPYSAKRIVPKMAAAGALAGVIGGVSAERIGSLVHVSWVLPLLAVLSALCAISLWKLGDGESAPAKGAAKVASTKPLDVLRGKELLRQMAILIVLTSVAENLVEYALMSEANRSIPDTEQLVRFFAAFYVSCGLATFAFQATLGSALLRRIGLAGSVAVLPAAVAVTGLVSVFVPRLSTIVAVRAIENISWGSAFQSGYELLYTPIAPDIKRRIKPWIDVTVRSVGSILGALLVLGLIALFPVVPPSVPIALAVALSLVALLGIHRIHGCYVAELGESLRGGALQLKPEDAEDATTINALTTLVNVMDRQSLLEEIERYRQQGLEPASVESTVEPHARAALAAEESSSGSRDRGSDEAYVAGATESAADLEVLLERIVDLSSGDPPRVRRALHARSSSQRRSSTPRSARHDRLIAAHAIGLLAEPEISEDVMQFLRRVGSRCVGLFVDGLHDRTEATEVRLALARLLAEIVDRSALDGLWRGLDEADPILRRTCLDAAVRLVERSDLEIPRQVVLARIAAEIDGSPPEWSLRGEEIEIVCAFLSLVYGRQTLRHTIDGLRGENSSMRGTALEFFESVLPPAQSRSLFERLGIAKARKS